MNNYGRVSFDLTKKLEDLGFRSNKLLGSYRQNIEESLYNPRKDEWIVINEGSPIVFDYTNTSSGVDKGLFLINATSYEDAFEFLIKKLNDFNKHLSIIFNGVWVLQENNTFEILAEGKENCLKTLIDILYKIEGYKRKL